MHFTTKVYAKFGRGGGGDRQNELLGIAKIVRILKVTIMGGHHALVTKAHSTSERTNSYLPQKSIKMQRTDSETKLTYPLYQAKN